MILSWQWAVVAEDAESLAHESSAYSDRSAFVSCMCRGGNGQRVVVDSRWRTRHRPREICLIEAIILTEEKTANLVRRFWQCLRPWLVVKQSPSCNPLSIPNKHRFYRARLFSTSIARDSRTDYVVSQLQRRLMQISVSTARMQIASLQPATSCRVDHVNRSSLTDRRANLG